VNFGQAWGSCSGRELQSPGPLSLANTRLHAKALPHPFLRYSVFSCSCGLGACCSLTFTDSLSGPMIPHAIFNDQITIRSYFGLFEAFRPVTIVPPSSLQERTSIHRSVQSNLIYHLRPSEGSPASVSIGLMRVCRRPTSTLLESRTTRPVFLFQTGLFPFLPYKHFLLHGPLIFLNFFFS